VPPLDAAPPAAGDASDPLAPPSPRDAVLLVEDNGTIAELIHSIMEVVGLRVIWCEDGAGALRRFAQHRAEIALVLVDCRLPDGDGRDFCLRLLHEEPGLPVLVTSGSASGRGVAPLIPSPRVQYLAKPYAPAHLIARVRSLLAADTAGPN